MRACARARNLLRVILAGVCVHYIRRTCAQRRQIFRVRFIAAARLYEIAVLFRLSYYLFKKT